MKKLATLSDLKNLKTHHKSIKDGIYICTGGGCIASGAMDLKIELLIALDRHGLKLPIVETGCMGPCAGGPVLRIEPDSVIYENVNPRDIDSLVHCHFIKKEIYTDKVHINVVDNAKAAQTEDIDFFQGQKKIVLRNCGTINPTSIEDSFAVNGYQAFAKVLEMENKNQVLEGLKTAGLKGRGGAGFPTHLKWRFTKEAESDQKYILCNADEGDPGAFMDRSILEGDPHSLIEGMLIGAYTIGASQGFVYVRAEYPLAVARLEQAIRDAETLGLLGQNILGTNFSFSLEIRMGSGAFVCGEETALIHSIEGKRGEPRPRPPFPAQEGLWGKPTLLNNVETYANIPYIFYEGAEAYAALGTEESHGTKIFALAGAVNNTGLVEVPIGTQLGELIYDIGGGIKGGKQFKAAQVGGPSGGCIPKENLNVPMDYNKLKELGAIMGSGGLIIMDEETCMVDVARFFLEFVQEESCGKCVPCRVGTKRMLEMLERICSGEGQEGDIEKLVDLGQQVRDTALCGLGQTAANPVLSTIMHFRNEYEQHIKNKHCEAGVCPQLVRAPCQSACPAHVDIPGFVSLTKEKRYGEALLLHRERNPFAAVCSRVCFHTCEEHCRRSSLDDSVSVRGVKRFLVDQEVTVQVPEVRENSQLAAKKVAVIGAGPAGLSCAYFLARMGYKPRIYEAESRPGGMLTQAIPAYRLPRELLAREVRMIERIGVSISTETRLGKDITLNGLKQEGAEAVFLAIGAAGNTNIGIPGEDAANVVQAVPFLKQYNIRGSVPVGEHVVVIGGGNAAIDAARTALRLGAQDVSIIYRRAQEQMPAYAEEIEEAIHEGVTLQCLMQPVKIEAKDGKVSGIRCLPMMLGDFDRSGRRHPEESGQQEQLIKADQVILAIGQRLDLNFEEDAPDIELSSQKFLKIHGDTCQTSVPWIFSGGDAVTGPASVVEAIAAGEKAAIEIDRFICGESNAFWLEEKEITTDYDPEDDPVPYPREKLPLLDVERRKANFDEVESCWQESVAIRQAARCLRCDYGKTTTAPGEKHHG